MSRSYGSAGKRRLKLVAESAEFQDVWGIAKDQIDVSSRARYAYVGDGVSFLAGSVERLLAFADAVLGRRG